MQKMKWAVVPLTLAALAGGTAAVAGSAIAASTSNTELDCSTTTFHQGPAVACTAVSDSFFQTVRILDLTTHTAVAGTGAYEEPSFFVFPVTPGNKYKVTIRTSNKVTDTYRVTSDGDVTVLHAG